MILPPKQQKNGKIGKILGDDVMKATTLFGKMLSFSRLQLNSADLTAIEAELREVLKEGSTVPVVLDSECELDLQVLVEKLWTLGVQPIGVVEGILTEQANALRLATFPADGKRIERIKANPATIGEQSAISKVQDKTEDKAEGDVSDKPSEKLQSELLAQAVAATAQHLPLTPSHPSEYAHVAQGVTSSVHNQMLRSGQSLQHLGGDLIIIGGVNKGAEAITDNSLHVYGHGQGRLVAGATGDKEARIFCQKFNPTLVSVAGTYCLSEAIPPEMIDKAVQVRYDEKEGLVFTLMAM